MDSWIGNPAIDPKIVASFDLCKAYDVFFLSCCWRRWVVVRCIAYPLRNTERRFWSYNVKSWSFVIPHRNHFLKEKEKRLNQLQAYNSLNARYLLFSLDCCIDWVSVGNALLLNTCIWAHVSCVVITVLLLLLLLTPAISSVSGYLRPFLSCSLFPSIFFSLAVSIDAQSKIVVVSFLANQNPINRRKTSNWAALAAINRVPLQIHRHFYTTLILKLISFISSNVYRCFIVVHLNCA